MKIVITGALGYVGTELCQLYKNSQHTVIAFDNRFLAERVKDLCDAGISFVCGSILDEKLVEEVLKDADVIYHLAGITDVAYTKFESNSEQDNRIKEVGIDGSKNVIKHSGHAKIIFPSTHVVYEGLLETKLDIEEVEPPCPVLSYATGKYQTEKDLQSSGKNYIILRLGSVYGYSTDSMRINIMPNLFSKIASQNGEIKLFAGGMQYKSLVGIGDVVSAMKFLAEFDVHKEIFHLSNENLTVKDVADICSLINPGINIISTSDQIPNLGYTLSNKKLLNTGFKFRQNIQSAIGEMINRWSTKDKKIFTEIVDVGGKEFIDERGRIVNYELTESINLVGYIESKAKTIRANHYHPKQEQKCLLIKGKYLSVTKDLGNPNAKLVTRMIKAGDLAIISPNVAHAMLFLEDSIFLNLVCGEREHQNYGITHTIPYQVIDDKLKEFLLSLYKNEQI